MAGRRALRSVWRKLTVVTALALVCATAAQVYQPLTPVAEADSGSTPFLEVASGSAHFYVDLSPQMAAPVLRIDRRSLLNTGTVKISYGTPTALDAGSTAFREGSSLTTSLELTPPQPRTTLYIDVELSSKFALQVSDTPAHVLNLGDVITAGGVGSGASDFYFTVSVPSSERGISVRATMTNRLSSLLLYVTQTFTPITASGLVPAELANDCYEMDLPAGQTSYIHVVSDHEFTIMTVQSALSAEPAETAGVIISGCVIAVMLLCVLVGCKTHTRDTATDSRVRYVVWSSALLSCTALSLCPIAILVVGIVMFKSLGYMGIVLITVGAAFFALALVCAGPRAFDMDAATGKFTTTAYWALVVPAHTEYNIADIAQFSMKLVPSVKGDLLYIMAMHMRDEQVVPLERGISEASLQSRQNLISKLNKLLLTVNGQPAQPTSVQLPLPAIPEGGSPALTPEQQAALIEAFRQQQDLLAQQQALLAQRQAAVDTVQHPPQASDETPPVLP